MYIHICMCVCVYIHIYIYIYMYIYIYIVDIRDAQSARARANQESQKSVPKVHFVHTSLIQSLDSATLKKDRTLKKDGKKNGHLEQLPGDIEFLNFFFNLPPGNSTCV